MCYRIKLLCNENYVLYNKMFIFLSWYSIFKYKIVIREDWKWYGKVSFKIILIYLEKKKIIKRRINLGRINF